MTIYTLCLGTDIGGMTEGYVTNAEDIEQLAIDEHWGILTEPEPGRLLVTVDMVQNTVRIIDTGVKSRTCVEYDILEFKRKRY